MKKVKITVTIDKAILSELDGAVRTRQRAELERGDPPSTNRSSLVEDYVSRGLREKRKE